MRYRIQLLFSGLLFFPLTWSLGKEVVPEAVNIQIEAYGDVSVPANKAILEFEMGASDVKTARAKAKKAAAFLKPLLSRNERSLLQILAPSNEAESPMGFGSKASPKSSVRFQVTVQVPRKQAALRLSERMNAVFEAMASKNAVKTSVVFDATEKAAIEKRAMRLALKNAQGLAKTLKKQFKSAPVMVEMAAQPGLSILGEEEGFIAAKQPFFITFRKNIAAVFRYLTTKASTAALIKKAV